MGWNLYDLPFRDNNTDRKEAYEKEIEKFKENMNQSSNNMYWWINHDDNGSFTSVMDELTNGEFSKGHWDDKMETWLSNALTGDLDHARQIELMQYDQAFNSAEAEKNRQFNLDVANTAYQRQAEDLKKAGYNPALVLGGGASSVPSSVVGSSHHQSYNHIDAILPFLSGVIGSTFNLVANSMRNNTALNVAQLNNNNKNKNEKNIKVVPSWMKNSVNENKKANKILDLLDEIGEFF